MRAVASFNKLAGIPKMSGYKQTNAFGPGLLAMNSQVNHILERMASTFEELDKTRKMAI